MRETTDIIVPEQVAPTLISVRTRAFELSRAVAYIVSHASGREEALSVLNATLLGKIVETGIASLYEAETVAYKLLAQQYARIERVLPPSENSIVRAYSTIVDTRDILVAHSFLSSGKPVEEASLAAPNSPVIKKIIAGTSEKGLTALPEILKSLGYTLASTLLEVGETPLGLAFDLELLSSFTNALNEYAGTPAENILCHRLDIYALRIAAGVAPLAKKNPRIAEIVKPLFNTCRLDRDKLVGVIEETDYYTALEQALAGSPYVTTAMAAARAETLPLVDTVIHNIRKKLHRLAVRYSLSDPLEEWFACPVMELMLLSVEDVSALASSFEMGLARESLPLVISVTVKL